MGLTHESEDAGRLRPHQHAGQATEATYQAGPLKQYAQRTVLPRSKHLATDAVHTPDQARDAENGTYRKGCRSSVAAGGMGLGYRVYGSDAPALLSHI